MGTKEKGWYKARGLPKEREKERERKGEGRGGGKGIPCIGCMAIIFSVLPSVGVMKSCVLPYRLFLRQSVVCQ